ncbi:MAG: hypothetical protein SF172_08505 [Burkholderiales bacterium]|nr:hypothetical protein [Burkholderiales bacterium]
MNVMFLDTKTVAAFKRLFEREVGEEVDAVSLANNPSYARYYCRVALKHRHASIELQAIAQRIRVRLKRATVIDPETLTPFDYGGAPAMN